LLFVQNAVVVHVRQAPGCAPIVRRGDQPTCSAES
jgi:hypothetical protein